MSRELTTSVDASITREILSAYFTLHLGFDSGDLYMWTGNGQQDIGGITHLGTGQILSLSEVEETSDISARGITVVMTGLDPSILSLALSEPYQGRVATLSLGVDEDYTEVTEIFSGYMDTMDIDYGGETCSVKMTIENKLIDLERPRAQRYTSAYQKSLYPNDKGFDFVEGLQDQQFYWGRKVNNTSSNASLTTSTTGSTVLKL